MVLDLDGTLLANAADVPTREDWPRRSSLVFKLNNKGVRLTVATGRTFVGARAAVETICTGGRIPVVLCNGSVVMDQSGAVLGFEAIPAPALTRVASLLSQVDGNAFIYFLSLASGANHPGLGVETVHYIGNGEVPASDFNGMPVQLGLPDQQSAVAVAMLIVTPSSGSPATLVEELGSIPGISITRSGTPYIEVRPADSTKAKGLARALSALNLTRDKVMAIGDNYNDVEMMELCGLSISVANASPRAKAASDFVTSRSSADGVVEALDLLRRVKRLAKGGLSDGRHKRKT